MKKILFYFSVAVLALGFASCDRDCEKKYLQDASPDAGFAIYVNGDSTTYLNTETDTILVTDKVTFLSTADHDLESGLEEKYAIYTSFNDVQYGAYTDDYGTARAHGTGISLVKSGTEYKYTNYKFSTPGTYKLYFVATINAKDGGCYKRVVDSSKTVTVYDPDYAVAEVYSVTVDKSTTQTGSESTITSWVSWLAQVTATVSENDTGNVITITTPLATEWAKINPSSGYNLLLTIDASSSKLTFDGTTINNTSGLRSVLKVNSGSKLVVTSEDGKQTATYTFEFEAPAIFSAISFTSIKAFQYASNDFKFSAYAAVDTNTKVITLPQLPYGTTRVAMNVTQANLSLYPVYCESLPYSIVCVSPNEKYSATYSVVKRSVNPEQSATFESVSLVSPAVSFITKSKNEYVVYPIVQSADESFKFVFDIDGQESYSQIYAYVNGAYTTYSDSTTAITWTSSMADSLPLIIVNGTDTNRIRVNINKVTTY